MNHPSSLIHFIPPFAPAGFLPVRAWSSTVLVRTSAGGTVPASGRYQVVQYGGRRGTGSTGTETVLKRVCCLRLQGKHILFEYTKYVNVLSDSTTNITNM